LFRKLKSLLNRKDKQVLFVLILFSFFISIIETAGVSVIMPFLAVSLDFTLIHSNYYYNYIYHYFNFNNDSTFVIIFGMLLISFYLFRGVINLFYFSLLNKFVQKRYSLLSYRLFENYMNMSYKDFTTKNSSVLTKTIISEAANLTSLIAAILLVMSEIFVVVLIYAMLLYVNYVITLLLTVILLLNATVMLQTVSKKIKKSGAAREKVQRSFYEIINRSFGNFKLIKLQANNVDILEEFETTSSNYADINGSYATLSQVPRLFLEAIGFSLIVFLIIYLVWKSESDIVSVLSLVSIFILALYRLLPSVNRIMSGYNQILFLDTSLDIIHKDLMYDSENLGIEKLQFSNQITLTNIEFEYEKNKKILKDINLVIKKGEKIAFIGESGSGKSTLVDIIIGLYQPKLGQILIDGVELLDKNLKDWRSKIGYIPQTVYLFDGTVGENVAFGFEYNIKRVDECLRKAKIYDFLYKKNGQDTLVGEGGVMLSGGQKQRISIARALYANPDILVLDEATSALDNTTEKEIMNEIYNISNGKTLIIIAHRLSTIERCEKIYKLEDGELVNAK